MFFHNSIILKLDTKLPLFFGVAHHAGSEGLRDVGNELILNIIEFVLEVDGFGKFLGIFVACFGLLLLNAVETIPM